MLEVGVGEWFPQSLYSMVSKKAVFKQNSKEMRSLVGE